MSQLGFICGTCSWWMVASRRTGQHPFGGSNRVLPEWQLFAADQIRWGGGGVVPEIFRDLQGVVPEMFSVSYTNIP